ncbi:SusC/RagA family TonB-linked outer membrane protein [Sphingobacterium composti Ten et al. 2007 non Yoo et al. 2007]|uniref:SusC/RagA family TonB-linked outer membrane protein n=1 Tax=Sphingobacterium composti TaxID=363260 RepID=UPI00135A5989|nr:SusC/RagA family TonB-linked outer membrane protein [Sphingobacterium composti Ten et al. 2007 non Yoo et al. 2007]
MKKNIRFIALGILSSMICVQVYGQSNTSSSGRVVNIYNQPIKGATIIVEGGDLTLVTNQEGGFDNIFDVKNKYVVVSAPGYQNQRVEISQLIANREIQLAFDAHNTGGYLDFGYQKFTKESLTGSVSVVSGDVLNRTPSNVLSDTYQGRLPGLTVKNNIAELTFFGYGNYSKTIRGISSVNGNSPTIIIDGVIAPTHYLEFISPKEIETITVLKDASSTAAYGIQGASGMIVISTKRGNNSPLKVEGYLDNTVQQLTNRPLFINSGQYAELRNLAGKNDGLGDYSQFSQTEIDMFKSGEDPAYPNNDWYDMFMRKMVNRQRIGVNAAGGTDKFRYYSNLSFVNQQQPFKIADEPDRKYDPTPHVHIGNFRTNMDVKFNDYLSGYMRLTGNLKREKLAGGQMGWDLYSSMFNIPSTVYGPLSPIIEGKENISNQVITVDGFDTPIYGRLNRSGYSTIIETNIIAQAGLKLNMDFLTKGLSATGGMAYQTYVRNTTNTSQNFRRVLRGDDFSKLDDFTIYKSFENTPLVYGKGSTFFYYLNLLAKLDYSRRFGEHSIDASAHTFYLKQEIESAGGGNNVLPYLRQNFGVSALYGFKDRYFLKGDLGYSGSEQFHPDHRYTMTPAVSAAWIASKEDFLSIDAISLLKFRVSYGVSANDQLGSARFLYLDNIRANGSELERGNPLLQAEKIKKANVGVNLGLFNMITVDAEYFDNIVDNMLINSASQIPDYQGIPLGYYPKLNNGKMENRGYEVSLGFNKHLNQNLSFYVQGNFMDARNKVISINEASLGDDYAYSRRTEGYHIGQLWGYQVDYSNGNGMFNSAAELANAGVSYAFGKPRVGDLIYKDLTGDGVVDVKDLAPMGNPNSPQQEYSIIGGAHYKSFEFSFLIHGVSNYSNFLSGMGIYENQGRGIFNDIHLNSWTADRYAAGEVISFPALSLSPTTNHVASDFFLNDRSFWRLKNVELAYTLPEHISQKINSQKIRVAFNAQNLFTIHKMKTRYIDPEIGSRSTFQPYRVFNLGLSANF